MPDEDIHIAAEDSPLLTRYEPEFRRVFARGSLLRIAEDDPEILQVAFWSSKDKDVPLEDEQTGTGYRLETEVMMTWSAARRLRRLLDMYIEEYAPEPSANPTTSPTEDPDS